MHNLTLKASAIALIAAASMSTAHADGIVKAFTVDNIKAALAAVNAQNISSTKGEDNGKSIDVISFSSGDSKYIAIPTVCDTNGCLGLSLYTFWDLTDKVSLTTVNKFNSSYVFGRGYLTDDKLLAYGRYTIADGGVSETNVQSNIVNFAGGAALFLKFAKESEIVAMQTPGAPTTVNMSAPLAGATFSELRAASRAAVALHAVNDSRAPMHTLAPTRHAGGN